MKSSVRGIKDLVQVLDVLGFWRCGTRVEEVWESAKGLGSGCGCYIGWGSLGERGGVYIALGVKRGKVLELGMGRGSFGKEGKFWKVRRHVTCFTLHIASWSARKPCDI